MPKIVNADDTENLENLHYGMFLAAIEIGNDKGLKRFLDQDIDLDVRFKSEEFSPGYLPSPLMAAVRARNFNATRLIANKMKMKGILDFTEEAQTQPLLHHAIRSGDYQIVRVLLSCGADPNLSSAEETPLMTAVRKFSSYPIIDEGEWPVGVTKNSLEDWYNGKGEFPENAKAAVVKWKGNIKILNQILEAGADCMVKDNVGLTPLEFLNSLKDPKHVEKNMFFDDLCKLKFTNATDDEITFNIVLTSRDRKKEQSVSVTYDVREVRALLDQYKDKNRRKDKAENKRLKELETSFTVHKLETEKKLKMDEDSFDLKSRIKLLQDKPNTEKFYDISNKRLKIIFDAYMQLSSGMYVRAKNTKLDTAASVIGVIGKHVPAILKLPFTLFSAALSSGSNKKEQGRFEKISKLLPTDSLDFSKKMACEMTEALVKHAEDLRPGIMDKLTIEDMEDLSARSLLILIAKLHDVGELNIDPKLSEKERVSLLKQKLLEKDHKFETFVELLEEKIKHISPPSTPLQTIAFNKAKEKQAAFTKAHAEEERTKCVVM